MTVGGDDAGLERRQFPFPFFNTGFYRDHVDAVHRAGLYAEIAAGAFVCDHRVHLFCSAEDSAHRAGLNALGAPDTFVFANEGDFLNFRFHTMFFIERRCRHCQQVGEGIDGALAAGRAFVDRVTTGDGLGVGAASGITALTTLSLREEVIDLVDDGIAFHLEFYCGETQDRAEQRRQADQGNQGGNDGVLGHEFKHSEYQLSDYTRPLKPMKARDIKPAVIMPMAAPLKGTGTSATARRSRMAEKRISTIEKPTAPPKPYRVDSQKLWVLLMFNRATPSTAQLTVISGRKTPRMR